MIKQNHPYEELPEGMNLISSCPLCSKKYNPILIRVLEEKDKAHLVYITCKHCSSSVVALIVNGGMGVTSIGLITDLSADDVMRFKDFSSVSIDDVLDMHELIEAGPNGYLKVFRD